MDNYMYGFVNLLNNMFGHFMVPALHNVLFPTYYAPGLLKALITIGYILAAFELWTNKTVVD